MAFFAQFHKPAVVDVIIVNTSEGDLYRARTNIIDESAVVTHHKDGRGTCFEEILEPLNRLDVEVVGGLVEQQQIRMSQQYLRQFDTHAPAAGELATRSVKVLALEAQTDDGTVHLGNKARFIGH